MDGQLERFSELDSAIAKACGSIRVLKHLTWPESLMDTFLKSYRAGNLKLPDFQSTPVDRSAKVEELEALMAQCDRGHPIGSQLWKTAWSYATATRMLGAMGTPEFTEHSIALYGRPDHVYERQRLSSLDAANPIMEVTSNLMTRDVVAKTQSTIPSDVFAQRLRHALDEFFVDDEVAVVLDAKMSAKAAAGSNRVKVREDALFSDMDLAQLLNHEALIHTLTSINGKRQPLRSLGLGSPRTTKTQEGLAVFSELVTYSIDISRLRRVALRSQAVGLALNGGDFIEVFLHFLDGGQSEEESYHSAQRIFRGGDVRGSIAFTKDGAYLEGLILVQTFLKKAIADGREDLIPMLFAGRMTLGDVIELEELFLSGVLKPARYLPPWAVGFQRLAANLSYALFSSRIQLDTVELDRFLSLEEGALPSDR
ncbi:MAG: flavohemoglobin expression-modulating QEGLA motif protein [Acidimicrobiia bacterium]|nr:flavohemoglobin expression-modulating QEGLA motif protein [Acidimicrobiia bacterium]